MIRKRLFSTSSLLRTSTYRIAIIGSGPAAFYTVHHLVNKAPKSLSLKVDFFERLAAPYGLSRYGVAPDHPEVKNCEDYLNNLMSTSEDSARHNLRFFGNVEVGKDVSVKTLEDAYHSIVLAFGCSKADNKLDIPGANHKAVIPARQFVNWYNGHPDSFGAKPFDPPDLSKIKNVTIIGNGNVALDVARVLLANPDNYWYPTDITDEAYKLLKKSSVKNVNIIARRGFLQSAFTNKEIRELLETSGVNLLPIEPKVLEGIDSKKLNRIDKRRYALIEKHTTGRSDAPRSLSLQYLKSPIRFLPNETDPKLLSASEFRKNKLFVDDLTKTANIVPTEEKELIANELVILSIGYKGESLDGLEDIGVIFENNKIKNKEGRVLSSESFNRSEENWIYKHGWYTSGWIKNGPKGVIATTMMDSFNTADKILEDLANGVHINPVNEKDITRLIDDKISWTSWMEINKKELEKGKNAGKTRWKFCRQDEMIKAAG